MMDNQNIVLTQQGLENLKQELESLKNDKLPAAVDRLSKAREFGDLRENSEYHTAREDHAWIQGRIDELTDILSRATVAADNKSSDQINIGCKVTVEVNNAKHDFFIVGEWEANPAERKISHQSPLGQALVGRRVGEKVEVEAPAGKVIYTIKQVS